MRDTPQVEAQEGPTQPTEQQAAQLREELPEHGAATPANSSNEAPTPGTLMAASDQELRERLAAAEAKERRAQLQLQVVKAKGEPKRQHNVPRPSESAAA